MRKTIGTFLYYFSISFISSFFPKHFMQALKQFRNSTLVWGSIIQLGHPGKLVLRLAHGGEKGIAPSATN